MNNNKEELIRCMDNAVLKSKSTEEICEKVKSVLEEWVNPNTILLESKYLEPERHFPVPGRGLCVILWVHEAIRDPLGSPSPSWSPLC